MRSFLKLSLPEFRANLRAVLLGVATTFAMLATAPAMAAAPSIPNGPVRILPAAGFVLYAALHTHGECTVGARSASCITGKYAGVRVVLTTHGYVYSRGPVATGYGPCGPGYWSSPAPGICNIAISADFNSGKDPGVDTNKYATCRTESATLTYGLPPIGSHQSVTVDAETCALK